MSQDPAAIQKPPPKEAKWKTISILGHELATALSAIEMWVEFATTTDRSQNQGQGNSPPFAAALEDMHSDLRALGAISRLEAHDYTPCVYKVRARCALDAMREYIGKVKCCNFEVEDTGWSEQLFCDPSLVEIVSVETLRAALQHRPASVRAELIRRGEFCTLRLLLNARNGAAVSFLNDMMGSQRSHAEIAEYLSDSIGAHFSVIKIHGTIHSYEVTIPSVP